MPARNVIKSYLENGYYHIYNRGVEKRSIFLDKQDTSVLLGYLKEYLSPKDIEGLTRGLSSGNSFLEKAEAVRLLRMNNFTEEVDLLAYCLMSNHFHLLVKQYGVRSIEKFMKSLATRYVQYFNKRHGGRVGGLFQDAYKAVLVESSEQLLWLGRYIHRNPIQKGVSLKESPVPSSYKNYLGLVKQDWIKPGEILGYFSKQNRFDSYQVFVEDNLLDERSVVEIGELMIEETL